VADGTLKLIADFGDEQLKTGAALRAILVSWMSLA
jgi:hypothetical protein